MATKKIMTLQRLGYYDSKLKAWVKTLATTHVEFVSVTQLPASGESNKIYLVPSSGSGQNVKDEYIWLDGKWEVIGSTAAELSGYVKTTELENTLKNYATTESVTEAVEAVDTKVTNLTTTVNGHTNKLNQIEEDLEGVVHEDDLKDYAKTADVNTTLQDYVKNDELVEITEAEIDALFPTE